MCVPAGTLNLCLANSQGYKLSNAKLALEGEQRTVTGVRKRARESSEIGEI